MTTADWAARLRDPAALRDAGLFVAEGRLVLQRLLDGAAGGPSSIVEVLATPAAADALDLPARLPGRVVVRTPAEMEALAGFNFHRGVLALARRPARVPVAELLSGLLGGASAHGRPLRSRGTRHPAPGTPFHLFVVTEHLVDVDNVGSCFRNAHAFGAAGVLLDDRSADPLYRKAVRTSVGAVLEVPWTQAPVAELLDALDSAGVVTVGLTPRGDDVYPLDDVARRLGERTPVALVVGNEGHGLTASTLARCVHRACIPMAGVADSLNVATALAVALYAIRKGSRLTAQGSESLLSPEP